MEIKGSIRASATGIDVGIKGDDGKFHQIAPSPLLNTISDFYKFVISDLKRTTISDRTYEVDITTTKSGSVRRSITIPTALGSITIFRYTSPNNYTPLDKAGFILEIPTLSSITPEESNETN